MRRGAWYDIPSYTVGEILALFGILLTVVLAAVSLAACNPGPTEQERQRTWENRRDWIRDHIQQTDREREEVKRCDDNYRR